MKLSIFGREGSMWVHYLGGSHLGTFHMAPAGLQQGGSASLSLSGEHL